ncbi:hypothetical protein GCM10009759_14610 [Kitasatospora saccharophila]|uniref:Uncharacterized protein n=1 Tax=Kitasatospora saccharophila TaxID=407973 RepID=A0ABN2WFW1_9ACTN
MPFTTFETVFTETPASSATSFNRGAAAPPPGTDTPHPPPAGRREGARPASPRRRPYSYYNVRIQGRR